MTKSPECQLVLFERWPHPSGNELIAKVKGVNTTTLTFKMSDTDVWSALSAAHVYQVRSTRSELPEQYWVTNSLLESCPSLLAVSTNGSGSDTVDLEACTKAGVAVVNQAGGNKQAVAEHALAMMLTLSKQIIQSDRAMRRDENLARESYMGHNVVGKTLGIVGLGNIGAHVARLAAGLLEMKVLAYDPLIPEDAFLARGAVSVTFDELLRESDFVSVHCPRNAGSEYLFDAPAFASMKPDAYFITTARGGIHNEQALEAALRDGQLAGAGLDVWETEPPGPAHPLLALDNVIASPHTAGVTHESRTEMVRITIEQIQTIANAERPPRLLNPDVWPRYCERFEKILGRTP